MKILVTGATGFIGNYVIRELLAQGHEIIATSRSESKAQSCDWYRRVKYISYDVNDRTGQLLELFDKPEQLIHLAWEGLPNYQALYHIERNLWNHYWFLKSLIEAGLKRITVAGTCFEYGMQFGPLKEDTETRPTTAYGLAKDTLRKLIQQLQPNYKFDLKWLRLFYLYGPGQHSQSLMAQLEAALDKRIPSFRMSAGEQLRDYLPVSEVARRLVRIALQDRISGVINCCSGQPISVRKLVEDYIQKRGAQIKLELGFYPYPEYESLAFWGDPTRMNEALEAAEQISVCQNDTGI
ncbi:MAG: NAD(P)-dependent oxidoreductase [candidate division KSB1 bacterium]|nr:NAD(P)-dependent oxidoreductase [candidate division KSB1 bacterium]MDZ7317977.1 NAD(P)-dependent oxidoreductase [candidate division KSB1 bacterium]MDZ7340666.1 NAD(P)-dependent oxidoreductase [candidate division KSB1 bacterium]